MGAFGGRREIMERVAPVGSVYQAGTLSGNPVAMAAGLAQLRYLREHPEVYAHIESLGRRLRAGLREAAPGCAVTGAGSLCCLFFTPGPVVDYTTAKAADTARFARCFRFLLDRGIYTAPSQFEALFLSDAHTEGDVDALAACVADFFRTEKN